MSRDVIRDALCAVILGVVVFIGANAARADDPAATATPAPMGYGQPATMYGSAADTSCDEDPSFCSSCGSWWHACWWNNSYLYRRTVECHREKQFFHMYICGYGPAIHTRPVGRYW